MVTNDKINKYRERINLINLQILELLSSRGELAKKIGEEKRKLGLKVYDPKREEEIISQLLDQNRGPFDDEAIKDIFEEIFKASRDLQKK
ncbi:chorismate mutase [Staphylococcus delphini]|uniref:Chorismate mutase n=1 Tax=Staphylococcus delphini TaxID=53344 RepID=A0A2A4GTN4_9STAP|nr:chorismate mutase [Staphylococcus delphini]PCF44728.1 chorismate mutase [Staphylococcus delphini]PCF53214.1 chorismate mutase [Staphylococcus delphini]PCF54071.1 chorismate mutase [Staphylococcus delphini]PCF59250.1 chorismate mutase [Staphylococcus delphini]